MRGWATHQETHQNPAFSQVSAHCVSAAGNNVKSALKVAMRVHHDPILLFINITKNQPELYKLKTTQ